MESGAGNINGLTRPRCGCGRPGSERASEAGEKGWNIKGRNEKRPSPLHSISISNEEGLG